MVQAGSATSADGAGPSTTAAPAPAAAQAGADPIPAIAVFRPDGTSRADPAAPDDEEAHLIKVYSTGGLVHETNLSSSSAASLDGYVATSASIVDSLLMPMKATGDTRVVGNDVIVIRDPFAFRHAYANFVRAGPGRLQVLLDYDRTLTSFRHNGRPTDSCHGVIEKSHFASPEWRRKTEALFQLYYPMEVSTSLKREDKLGAMVQWWEQAHQLMVENRVHQSQIPTMVAESNMGLRSGARELLAELAQSDIPTLIFSAGIADVLTEFLRQQNALHPNVHVVSNRLKFGADGYLVGFQGELIHTLNKNAYTIANSTEVWAHQVERDHVLLVGDNIGDIHMSDGLPLAERLAIGFLNDRIQENLSTYRDTFDAVILNDGSMDLPRQLVQHIVTGRLPSEILGAATSTAL